MHYVNCIQCGRPVMTFNVCSYCQTLDQSQRPKPDSFTSQRAQPLSSNGLAMLAGLVAAGVAWWKTADEAGAAIAGVLTWLIARTRIGQVVVKAALAVMGLGLAWVVWRFFSELSKTFG